MIVLVEDDAGTRHALSELLDSMRLEYKMASTLTEGLDLIRKIRPSILLTDLRLGSKDVATPIIKECGEYNPECKRILMTAVPLKQAESILDKTKVDYILVKPFNIDELENILKSS